MPGPAASAAGTTTDNDLRLIDEAIGRVLATRDGPYLNVESIRTVMIAELQRGRRDLFSLVRAGRRALE